MKRTNSAGGVVISPEGRILVVNQKGDSWSLPKGHIEPYEARLQAAKREIYEESGINDLELVRELGTYKRYRIGPGGDDMSELKNITFFLFRTTQTDLSPRDKDNPEALWADKEQVAGLLTHPKDKEFFLRIKEQV